jgi:NAD(P)-dependent dehydrogenase (short-subunit alcohol dehydrogenase family)
MTVVENEGGSAAGVVERVPGLACKRILVTGGASGIGRSTALIAARSGAQVLVGDVNAEALKQLRQQAADGGLDIATTVLDTSSPQSVEQFLSAAQSPLHGLVCAAGIAPDAGTLDLDLDAWTRVLSVNLTGAFLLAQGAIRQMLEHGHGGSIVMLGSNMGSTGAPRLAHYAASKAGIVGLAKSLAREFGSHHIRVNTVSPGGINTPLYRGRMPEDKIRENVARMPLGRLGEPADVATAIAFLLSDMSSWITGQTLNVNGGSLMLV